MISSSFKWCFSIIKEIFSISFKMCMFMFELCVCFRIIPVGINLKYNCDKSNSIFNDRNTFHTIPMLSNNIYLT